MLPKCRSLLVIVHRSILQFLISERQLTLSVLTCTPPFHFSCSDDLLLRIPKCRTTCCLICSLQKAAGTSLGVVRYGSGCFPYFFSIVRSQILGFHAERGQTPRSFMMESSSHSDLLAFLKREPGPTEPNSACCEAQIGSAQTLD